MSKPDLKVLSTVKDIDLGYTKIMHQYKALKRSYTAIGFFGHGGTPADDVAARAAVMEYGATIQITPKMRGYFAGRFGVYFKKSKQFITIPKRPFMSRTFRQQKKNVILRQKSALNTMISTKGNFAAKQIMQQLGEWYLGEVKKTILSGKFKRNSKLTKQLKGSSKPLINTGEMLNSATHREFRK